jgi:hypothetical protein
VPIPYYFGQSRSEEDPKNWISVTAAASPGSTLGELLAVFQWSVFMTIPSADGLAKLKQAAARWLN